MSKDNEQNLQKTEMRQDMSPANVRRPLSVMDEMDRFFDSFMGRNWMRPLRWDLPSEFASGLDSRLPKIDIVNRDEEILVRAEAPGVDKDDLDVSLTENSVTIKGSTKKEFKEEKGEYHRCEIMQGAFARTVALPGTVDTERAEASFKDGVLEIRLPKTEKIKRRSIRVQ